MMMPSGGPFGALELAFPQHRLSVLTYSQVLHGGFNDKYMKIRPSAYLIPLK